MAGADSWTRLWSSLRREGSCNLCSIAGRIDLEACSMSKMIWIRVGLAGQMLQFGLEDEIYRRLVLSLVGVEGLLLEIDKD